MRVMFRAGAAALAMTMTAGAAHAAQIYSAPTGLVADEAFNGTLGLNFTVNTRVVVSGLGVFDGGSDGLARALTVAIYNRTTQAVIVAPITFAAGTANPTGSPYLFQSTGLVSLAPGSYQLATTGYFWEEMAYNSHGAASAIGFNSLGGFLTADSAPYGYGAIADNNDSPATRYGAGSFIATVAEPADWALMIGGFGVLGAALRRRRAVPSFA